MAHTKDYQAVTAIVCAHNEEARIGAVLTVVTQYPGFTEVIVVDDGSTDGTSDVVKTYPVVLVRHEQNMGKGRAMANAVKLAKGTIIFFSDADVKGLTPNLITETLAPVLSGKTDMMIAMRNRKIYFLRFVFSIIPLLGGERALIRALWEKVPTYYQQRFMIEAALNFYARYTGKGFMFKVFPGLSQTIKEKKYGYIEGFRRRLRMFTDIIHAQIRLQFRDVPDTTRSGRVALTNLSGGVVGTAFGIALLAASYTGPVQFIRNVWAEELLEDPDPVFVHLLLNIAGNVGADLLVALGIAIIGFNTLAVALNVKNIHYVFGKPASAQRVE